MISLGALEEAVLALLTTNSEHAVALALRANENLFTTNTNKIIARVALDFIHQYHKPPGPQLDYLLEEEYKRGDEGRLLVKAVERLFQVGPELDPQFVINQFDTFLSIQHMTASLETAMMRLQEGEVAAARQAIRKASETTEQQSSTGLWFHKPAEIFRALERHDDDFFSCGIDAIDQSGVSMARKTLTLFLAAKGRGKSWWAVELAKRGIQYGKKTLLITLEMAQEKFAQRIMQSVFSLTRRQILSVKVPFFSETDAGLSINFRSMTRSSLFTEKKKVMEQMEKFSSRLHIKEFPTGSLTTDQLILYLDRLKSEDGFEPDQVIVDYPNLMRIDRSQLRVDLGRQVIDLRGLAVSRNLVMACPIQGNRESDAAAIVDRGHVGEDWSQILTADVVLAYSQTAAEKKLGLARVLVASARDAEDRFIALIAQNYQTGQFCLDSIRMVSDVSVALQKTVGDGK